MYYGRKMGMKEPEILLMRYGDMMDMIACIAIDAGGAEQKIRRKMSYEEVTRLR